MADWHQRVQAGRCGAGGELFRVIREQEETDLAHAQRLKDPGDMVTLRRLMDEQREREALVAGVEALDIRLARPFRKPPLPYPSRFGRVSDPGILYASRAPLTCLAEKAYYQFRFLHDQQTPPPKAISATYALLVAGYSTPHGLPLDAPTWQDRRAEITSPLDYTLCQAVGQCARQAGIKAIEFPSARLLPYLTRRRSRRVDAGQRRGDCNIAVLSPQALSGDSPRDTFRVSSQETQDLIRFFLWGMEPGVSVREVRFRLAPLLVNGQLPIPS
ncbi:RES family NAD+ phosphorylase [Halomonas sp. BM-2019]|uniref:RES family NAD+ phosphorylase n=1 Tax=Halomonas sp. BM-2019 TaxID=2811227 RepID=UPI001B3C3B8F|nr:MAG: RES family NAD+ phosphorylase [Halomonas sp. BM-2019]